MNTKAEKEEVGSGKIATENNPIAAEGELIVTESELANAKLRTASGQTLPAHWLAVVATIWTGFALSSFASMAASYAAVWYVTQSTASPLALATVYVCAFLPIGLLSPIGGLVADRFSRKAIIIGCDFFMAATALSVGIAVAIGHASLPLVLVFATACGVAQAFRTPAFNATMPLLVPEVHLLRINTLDAVLSSASMIFAPALGILLYTTLGLQMVLFVHATGAVAAALTMCVAAVPRIEHVAVEQQSAWLNMREGFTALSSNKGVLVLVAGVVLGMMAYGPLDSLLPLMVSSHFGGNGYQASLVTAVFGIGMLLGSLALMALGDRAHLARIIVGAAAVVGGATLAAGLLPESAFAAFALLMGIMAFACAGFSSPLMTILQKSIGEDKLGRVMGLFSASLGLAVPLGTAFGGVAAEALGVPGFFATDGVVILAMAAMLALSPSVRRLNAGFEHASCGATPETPSVPCARVASESHGR